MNKLSITIPARRKALGLTQEELAKSVGTSMATIGFIETGDRIPSVALLTKIADKLDSSVDDLLGRENRS